MTSFDCFDDETNSIENWKDQLHLVSESGTRMNQSMQLIIFFTAPLIEAAVSQLVTTLRGQRFSLDEKTECAKKFHRQIFFLLLEHEFDNLFIKHSLNTEADSFFLSPSPPLSTSSSGERQSKEKKV